MLLGADHLTLERGVGDFEKRFPASACQKKKIACSTNVIKSLREKREKNILPTILLEKKFLMTRNHPPPPSRVKWSAPYIAQSASGQVERIMRPDGPPRRQAAGPSCPFGISRVGPV